jgi:hypothetical protein
MTTQGETPRAFVHFILTPFYKIITSTITAEKHDLIRILKLELGVLSQFKKEEYDLDIN